MIRKNHDSFYDSRNWMMVREKRMRKDNYECQLSKRFKPIPDLAQCVHHILPREVFPEYELKMWNLISLSNKWHNKMHDRNTGNLTEIGMQLVYIVCRERKLDYNEIKQRIEAFYG